jgi:hypothetical protein
VNLSEAIAKEEEARQRLIEEARAVGRGHVSQATIAASQAIIGAIAGADGGSALGEPGRDLRRIRQDPKVQQAVAADVAICQADSARLILGAVVAGYAIGGQTRAVPLGLEATVTDQDRAELAEIPVQGFTVAEWATDVARALGDGIQQALALPLSTTVDPRSIPAELGRVADASAGRLASAVEQAHLAGVAAAVRGVGLALTGKG